MKQWFVIYAQPRMEMLAHEHLKRQGFETFFPRYLKRRSHSRRIDMVPAPLFPRYLFVSFDIRQSAWRAIRSTRGVIDLVRNGTEPLPVPAGVIEEIESRRDADGYVVVARHLDLKPGSKIRIESGAFADTEAIFAARRDNDRVVALLSLLGRKVLTQLPVDAIAPA